MGKTNKILYVMSGQNFQDEEYFESKKIFEAAGYKTEVASTFIGTAQGKLGGMTNIDLLFSEVDAIEFDAVIVTPSVASLPFDPTQEIDVDMPLSEHEKECIEEERRLLYVAFTRAKKFLMAYLGKRENAIMNMVKYAGDDTSLGICERHPGLDNYNIGFNTDQYGFKKYRNIAYQVEKNAPVVISKENVKGQNGTFPVFNIKCNGITVGQLSKSSSIRQTMEKMDISQLKGFFVSDVFYWTYEDTVAADERRKRKGSLYLSRLGYVE